MMATGTTMSEKAETTMAILIGLESDRDREVAVGVGEIDVSVSVDVRDLGGSASGEDRRRSVGVGGVEVDADITHFSVAVVLVFEVDEVLIAVDEH